MALDRKGFKRVDENEPDRKRLQYADGEYWPDRLASRQEKAARDEPASPPPVDVAETASMMQDMLDAQKQPIPPIPSIPPISPIPPLRVGHSFGSSGLGSQRAALRPLKQPLYDTVLYPNYGKSKFNFFTVPMGQPLSCGFHNKTSDETNMQSSSQLGTPQEFHLYGFRVSTGPNWTEQDIEKFRTGRFEFLFGGRCWFNVPLVDMTVNQPAPAMYNCTIGKKPICIHSNEAFHVVIAYSSGPVEVSADNTVKVSMMGVLHAPL